MIQQKYVMQKKIFIASCVIFLAAIYRLLPHPPNATPVGAMALVGGIYLGRKILPFLVPILALFISDLILNNTINKIYFEDATGFIFFSDYMIFTYIAFILTVCIGLYLKDLNATKRIIGGSVLASISFFILTNFGSWALGTMYPKDFGGLMACFAAGIPFYWNDLFGNLLFMGIFTFVIEASFFSRKQSELA